MGSLIRCEESKVAAGGVGAASTYCRPLFSFRIMLFHGYGSGRLRSSAGGYEVGDVGVVGGYRQGVENSR
jgi:hypothetical protein